MCSSKYCIVFVNLIFVLLALVLLIIGSTIQISLNGNYGMFSDHVSTPVALIISFGALLSLSSLLALLGVYFRSHFLLSVYVFTMFVLIVVELSVGIAGFVVKSRVLSLIADSMRSAEPKYTINHFASADWDSVQRDLKCCGVDSHNEWFAYLGNSSLPDSCCIVYTVDCGCDAVSTANFYQTSCNDAISTWTRRRETPAAILFPFIIIFQTLSVLCSKRYRKTIQYDHFVDVY